MTNQTDSCCPYKRECATPVHWLLVKKDFIRDICDTGEYIKCSHYFASLKPQHEHRERLYGDPHYGE